MGALEAVWVGVDPELPQALQLGDADLALFSATFLAHGRLLDAGFDPGRSL
jgi:hypothetical protein